MLNKSCFISGQPGLKCVFHLATATAYFKPPLAKPGLIAGFAAKQVLAQSSRARTERGDWEREEELTGQRSPRARGSDGAVIPRSRSMLVASTPPVPVRCQRRGGGSGRGRKASAKGRLPAVEEAGWGLEPFNVRNGMTTLSWQRLWIGRHKVKESAWAAVQRGFSQVKLFNRVSA
jgi:hypothetical protein